MYENNVIYLLSSKIVAAIFANHNSRCISGSSNNSLALDQSRNDYPTLENQQVSSYGKK
jgi:hypothetical protein